MVWLIQLHGSSGHFFVRDSVTRFFASGLFHEPVSPQPQSIPLRPFRIFSKIRGDIRKSISEKIRNSPNAMIKGLGETDNKKTRSKKSRDTVS